MHKQCSIKDKKKLAVQTNILDFTNFKTFLSGTLYYHVRTALSTCTIFSSHEFTLFLCPVLNTWITCLHRINLLETECLEVIYCFDNQNFEICLRNGFPLGPYSIQMGHNFPFFRFYPILAWAMNPGLTYSTE